MGTTEQQIKNPAQKSYDDWEKRWKRDQEHKIQEKQALLRIVRAGIEYLRLTQLKVVDELEELATAQPPVLAVPDLGIPRPPAAGPPKAGAPGDGPLLDDPPKPE